MSAKHGTHAKHAPHIPAKHRPSATHPHAVPILDDMEDAPGAGAGADLEPNVRYRMISEAAYHRYVDRGCADGFENDDWLAAEADVERELRDATKLVDG